MSSNISTKSHTQAVNQPPIKYLQSVQKQKAMVQLDASRASYGQKGSIQIVDQLNKNGVQSFPGGGRSNYSSQPPVVPMKPNNFLMANDENYRDVQNERAKRRSSKEDQELTTQKIINIFENNKFFPHLYDPYYDRKDVKGDLAQSLMKAQDTRKILNPHSSTFDTVMNHLPVRAQRQLLSDMTMSGNLSPQTIQKYQHLQTSALNTQAGSSKHSPQQSISKKVAAAADIPGSLDQTEHVGSQKAGSVSMKSTSRMINLMGSLGDAKNINDGKDTHGGPKVHYMGSRQQQQRNEMAKSANTQMRKTRNSGAGLVKSRTQGTTQDGLSTMMSFNGEKGDKQLQNNRYDALKGVAPSTYKKDLRKVHPKQNTKLAEFKSSIQKLIQQVDKEVGSQKNMDPYTRKLITMNTEDQLYKFKSKIYKDGAKRIVDGFSLFFDEATRQAIQVQVKKEMIKQKKIKLAKKGHDVDAKDLEVLDDNQIMLKLIDESVRLMKREENELPEVADQDDPDSPARIRSPFSHIKVNNIERVIHYLRYSNDKDAQQQRMQREQEIEMKLRMQKLQGGKAEQTKSGSREKQTLSRSQTKSSIRKKDSRTGSKDISRKDYQTFSKQSTGKRLPSQSKKSDARPMQKRATNPTLTGIEQKLNERQKKKEIDQLKQRYGFQDQKGLTAHQSQQNFHVVNQLYDRTSGLFKKGGARQTHTDTFITQANVSLASEEDDPTKEDVQVLNKATANADLTVSAGQHYTNKDGQEHQEYDDQDQKTLEQQQANNLDRGIPGPARIQQNFNKQQLYTLKQSQSQQKNLLQKKGGRPGQFGDFLQLNRDYSHSQLNSSNRDANRSVLLSDSRLSLQNKAIIGFDAAQSRQVTAQSVIQDAESQGMSKKDTLQMIQNIMNDHNSIRIIENNQMRIKHLQQRGGQPQVKLSRRIKKERKQNQQVTDDPYVAKGQPQQTLPQDQNQVNTEAFPSIEASNVNNQALNNPYEQQNVQSTQEGRVNEGDQNHPNAASDVYGFNTRPASTMQNTGDRAHKSLYEQKRDKFMAQRAFHRTSCRDTFLSVQKRQRSVHQQQLVNDLILSTASNPDFNHNLQINRIKHEIKKQQNLGSKTQSQSQFTTTHDFNPVVGSQRWGPNKDSAPNLSKSPFLQLSQSQQLAVPQHYQSTSSFKPMDSQAQLVVPKAHEINQDFPGDKLLRGEAFESTRQFLNDSSIMKKNMDFPIDDASEQPLNQSVFNSQHNCILQEQSIIQDTLKNFRQKEEEESGKPKKIVGDQKDSRKDKAQKLQVMGQDYRFDEMVQAFIRNVMTLCYSQTDDEARVPQNQERLSFWPKSQDLKAANARYTDQKSEHIVHELGSEFKIIQNGIKHLIHVSDQEKIRAQLRAKRRSLKEKLAIFKDLKDDGLHLDNVQQLVQEVKNRCTDLQHFDEGQLHIESEDEPLDALEDGALYGKVSLHVGRAYSKHHKKRRHQTHFHSGMESHKVSKNELMRHFRGIIEETVEVLILDNACQEKIKQINMNIDDGDESPELHLLEEMLNLYYKQLEFDRENFSAKDAVKNFRKDNTNISDFLLRNKQKLQSGAKHKIWKPDKYNFNRKNPMCENIRQYL